MRRFVPLLLLSVLAAPVAAQELNEGLSRWELAKEVGLPAAGHYTLGGFTHTGAELGWSALLRGDNAHLVNEAALVTNLVVSFAFERIPLTDPGKKVDLSIGVDEAAVRLDGGLDLLERSSSGIQSYLRSEFGIAAEVAFVIVAAGLEWFTLPHRDIRQ